MGTLVYVVVTRGDSWSTGREFESASLSISVLFLPLLPIFVLAFISCQALMSLKGNNQQPTQSLYYGNTVLDYIMLYLYSEVPLYLYLKYTSKKVFSHKKIHLLLWCNPLWIENLFRGTGDRTRRTLMKMYYEAVSLFALVFLKNGPIPASFCLFSSFSHYNFNNTNWKKHRWCAWDSNPGPQNGRRRRNHGAIAATLICPSLLQTLFFNRRQALGRNCSQDFFLLIWNELRLHKLT